MSQLNIFTHEDIFQHIFYFLCSGSLTPFFIIRIKEVCKDISITSDTWKYCFSNLKIQIPSYTIQKDKIWLTLLRREQKITKNVDICINCLELAHQNTMFAPFAQEGDSDELYFDIGSFNLEKFFHILDFQNDIEILITFWDRWLFQKELSSEGKVMPFSPQVLISYDPVYSQDAEDPEGDHTVAVKIFKFEIQFCSLEEDLESVVLDLFEEQLREIIRVFLKEGLHPYNNISCKISFGHS
jgi:hypothetical protein